MTLYSRCLTLTRRNCIQHLAVWKKANRKWIVSLLWYIYTIDAFMSAVIGSNRVLSILLVIIRVNNGNCIKLCCRSCYFLQRIVTEPTNKWREMGSDAMVYNDKSLIYG
jgi:hypothetical protein